VANAQHNDAQDPEELFVKACFADEGPTLRRFAARARGRGTRINKRTCHITIVLDRLDDDRLSVLQAKDAKRTPAGRRTGATSSAAARRERVERSRARTQNVKAEEATDDVVDVSDVVETTEVVETTPQGFAAVGETTSVVAGEWAGSAVPNADGSGPEGFDIKGNADSMLFHEPGTRYFKATKAEVYFDTVDNARAAGFAAPGEADAEESATETESN